MARQRLPDQVKAKRGTLRKCRAQACVEAPSVTTLVNVKVPSRLKGVAKKTYEFITRQCFAMGILTEIDVHALELYAFEYAELVHLQEQLVSEGYTIKEKTKNGVVMKINPLEKVVRAKLVAVNALGSQFGWSPLSRMRLRAMVAEDNKKDDFGDIIDG